MKFAQHTVNAITTAATISASAPVYISTAVGPMRTVAATLFSDYWVVVLANLAPLLLLRHGFEYFISFMRCLCFL